MQGHRMMEREETWWLSSSIKKGSSERVINLWVQRSTSEVLGEDNSERILVLWWGLPIRASKMWMGGSGQGRYLEGWIISQESHFKRKWADKQYWAEGPLKTHLDGEIYDSLKSAFSTNFSFFLVKMFVLFPSTLRKSWFVSQ